MKKIKCAGCVNIFMNDSDSDENFILKRSGKKQENLSDSLKDKKNSRSEKSLQKPLKLFQEELKK